MSESGWSRPIEVTFPCCGDRYSIEAKSLTDEPYVGTDEQTFLCPSCGKPVRLRVTSLIKPGRN